MTVVYINYMYLENNRVGDEYYPTVASIFIVNMLLITSIGYMISRNVKKWHVLHFIPSDSLVYSGPSYQ